ncbi:DinB family protein [Pedobacter sp. HMF7647]|uniref:DinB family protein n=1 Tax=Hufsiella arboris TaxID=2695275 RepID=A0A7K1Y7S5_9SPHI|nr:DinB family protein [Hufsiella arboris]MXV50635.1 DinB family protein [Hufsiella arboris]
MYKSKSEVWQRGPIEKVPALLQPVAHALLQAKEEVRELTTDFPQTLLWTKPAGCASVGFHLQHLSGVLDRLFTYARNETLSQKQFDELAAEGKLNEKIRLIDLVERFDKQLDIAIEQLKNTDERILTDYRAFGRARLASTVIGLLFHAAEHTMRHVGQLLVTVKVLKCYKTDDDISSENE